MCFKLYRVFFFCLLSSYHTTNEVISCCACYRMVDMYLYNCGESFTHSYCNRSDQFLMRAGLHQGCFLSPIRYITFMHRDFRLSQAAEDFWSCGLRIISLLLMMWFLWLHQQVSSSSLWGGLQASKKQ